MERVGSSCRAPAVQSGGAARASHDDPRSPNVHFGGPPTLQTPPKFHAKTPKESTKSVISGGKRKKILAPTLLGPPPFDPQLLLGPPAAPSGLFAAAFAAAFGLPTVKKPTIAAFDLPKCLFCFSCSFCCFFVVCAAFDLFLLLLLLFFMFVLLLLLLSVLLLLILWVLFSCAFAAGYVLLFATAFR